MHAQCLNKSERQIQYGHFLTSMDVHDLHGVCRAFQVRQTLSSREQAHPCALSLMHIAGMLTNSLCQMTSCPWRALPPMTT